MNRAFCVVRPRWIPTVLVVAAAVLPRAVSAQSAPSPPTTYEIQVDGESFSVESGQRPVKVQSKLKPGTSYTLAVRLAPAQVLRLSSVQMEYEMPAKVYDDKGKDVRSAHIIHDDFAFLMWITDAGHRLETEAADKFLDSLVDDATKRFTDHKATDLKKSARITPKFGVSSGKGVKITYKDDSGVAQVAMVFVLSGEKYTVAVVAEFREQDYDDGWPWVRSSLVSIEPLH